MMKPIPYGRQHITTEDIQAVVEVLQSDYLTQGPSIEAFEKAFASYIGCDFAVAVSNGTAALHLSALALEVGPGDKVITTPITFSASANCVRYCGAEVVFADIDPVSYTLDIQKVRALLEKHPKGTFKGVIPVDFAGYPVNLEAWRQLANEFGLWIIEDACHAPGGYFIDSNGTQQRCGNSHFADLAIFSFHPVKHIASGEGGMITTNDPLLYQKLLMLRTHGITKNPDLMHENHGGWYMEMQTLGYNYRLTDFQAALGLSQLSRADEGLLRRHEIAARYTVAFSDSSAIEIPHTYPKVYHAYHLYVIQVEDRKGLYDYLKSHQIYAQVHYIPVHTMPYYQQIGWQKGDFPISEAYYTKCLSLPMYPTLTNEEQDYVIEKVLEFAN
jgi:UDP-4-amino-4,6-dideoxy-N-acetyl-beta-L-altrosamine transaminase